MIWQALHQHFGNHPETTALLAEYQKGGYVARPCADLLAIPDAAIAEFYAILLAEKGSARSPVADKPDSSWMLDADFCFVNVRACGLAESHGTFIQAAKLLLGIRANAIHLAPFTLYKFGIIYAIASLTSIAPTVVDVDLTHAGFNPQQQLQALVDAAHLLGKTIGYDVEPHMTQFAIPVLMQPHLFRWIKIYEHDKRWLDYLQKNDEMMLAPNQQRIANAVQAIVGAALHEQQLDTLEILPDDEPQVISQKQRVYRLLTRHLIDKGYWTVLSHKWTGVGVPAYERYHEDDYAVFQFLDANGEENDEKQFGVLTPFRFYNDIPPNRVPEHPPQQHPPAVDTFCGIFPYWRDAVGFDFARYDSVDHIFDSVVDGNHHHPRTDRPTPAILRQAIDASKKPAHAYIGNLAERMGNEVEDYAELGFDLVMGDAMLHEIDRDHLEACFALNDRLQTWNESDKHPASIAYAIDTHDTGDPYLLGESVIEREGSVGMLARQFIARFLFVGDARRPLYTVMGAPDLSYGLYAANVQEQNLTWIGNTDHLRRYHFLEDIYEQSRRALEDSSLTAHQVTDQMAWWVVRRGRGVLIGAVAWQAGDYTFTPDLGENGVKVWTTLDFWNCKQQTSVQKPTFHIRATVVPHLALWIGASATTRILPVLSG